MVSGTSAGNVVSLGTALQLVALRLARLVQVKIKHWQKGMSYDMIRSGLP